MATVTRKAAWRAGAANGWNDDLVWYAAAMHRMKALTPQLDVFQTTFISALRQNLPQSLVDQMASIARQWSDPLSLGYQSQVHASFVPATSWPRFRRKKAIWHQCAHDQWFFIPWHRAYLVEFEAVVRKHIGDLGGPAATWGLLYWNYSDHRTDPTRLGLPKPLRNATLPAGVSVPGVTAQPDGTFANPLFDPTRHMTGDADPQSGTLWATATQALLRPHFANQQDTGFVSFGGGVLETPNNAALFHQDDEPGELDRQPHGSVHVQVNGSMALFETAGLDPVFWMHHCNIDRLWETYARTLGHSYPFNAATGPAGAAQKSWTKQRFNFLRPDATVKTWTAPEVIDVTALGYAYDSTAAPPLPPSPPAPPGSQAGPFGIVAPLDALRSLPQPITSTRNVPLAAEIQTRMSPPAGTPSAGLVAPRIADDTRWILRFTGIRALRPAPTSYEVYLGLGENEPAEPADSAHYVGLLSLFGVYEATREDASATTGKMRIFDVTPQVTALGPAFDLATSTIRLVPLNPERDLAGAGMSIEQITIESA